MTLQVLDSEKKRRTGLEAAEELTGDDHRDEDEKDSINIGSVTKDVSIVIKWSPWIEA